MTRWATRSAGAAILAVLFLAGARPATASQSAPPAATPAAAMAPGAPVTCRVGVDILSIYNLNIPRDTFDADFWIWSVCPRGKLTPLKTAEFMNANASTVSHYTHETVGDAAWDSMEVTGTFRHDWNLESFPFDRQTLQVVMEDSQSDATELVFQPDIGDSALEPDAAPGSWRVTQFAVRVRPHVYQTTYGDPRDPTGTSAYSRLTVETTLGRADLSSFLKLTFVVYIAFFMSLISYFLTLHSSNLLLARLTITTAALFAVAVNLNTVTSALSSESSLTMVDRIHIVALLAILADGPAALVAQWMENRGTPAARINRFNHRVVAGVVVAFVAANVGLIAWAAHTG